MINVIGDKAIPGTTFGVSDKPTEVEMTPAEKNKIDRAIYTSNVVKQLTMRLELALNTLEKSKDNNIMKFVEESQQLLETIRLDSLCAHSTA